MTTHYTHYQVVVSRNTTLVAGSCILIMEILHVIIMFPIFTFCANIYTELVYYW